MSAGALEGLRVLELGWGITPAHCTRLLADYGADVIKVEPVGGESMRRAGPFPAGEEHPEKSGLFMQLNANKRGITLDLDSPGSVELLRRLILRSDAVVENFAPGYLESIGLPFASLAEERPDLVLTSITPFGQTGPRRDWRATETVLFAMSGRMYGHGRQDREPLRYAPDVIWFQAGNTAAAATAASLFGAKLHGEGEWIDLSILEALVGNADSRVLFASYSGSSGGRSYRAYEYPRGAYPCKDGFILMGSGLERYFRRMCRVMGHAELLEDPRFADPAQRALFRDEWEALFYVWLVDRTRQEVFLSCQAEGVPCAPVLMADEVHRDPHLVARGYFTMSEHPVGGALPFPGAPFRMADAPWSLRTPAPLLGQHNDEVYGAELGLSGREIERLRADGAI